MWYYGRGDDPDFQGDHGDDDLAAAGDDLRDRLPYTDEDAFREAR